MPRKTTTAAATDTYGDDHFQALMDFIRLVKGDNACYDKRAPVRRNAVKRHLRVAAESNGVERTDLAKLVIRELSGQEWGTLKETVMSEHEDPDFKATSERMGYENMVRATTRIVDDIRHEFGIIDLTENESMAVPGKPWAVVVHTDCDPDHPDQGSSGRDDYASYEEALGCFNEEIANLENGRAMGL